MPLKKAAKNHCKPIIFFTILRRIFTFLLLLVGVLNANAQYELKEGNLPDEISILNHASIFNAGKKDIPIAQIIKNAENLKFKPLSGRLGNLGFTDDNYWVKFQIKNSLDVPALYYLQTAEPVTDNVNLYIIGADSKIQMERSGDNLDFSEKVYPIEKRFLKLR